jgi:hypothetical protein
MDMTKKTSRFTHEAPLPDLQLFLAERLWVPCLGFKAWNGSGAPCRAAGEYTEEQKQKCPCQGSGQVWPLRVDCGHCCVDGSNIMDNGLPAPCHICYTTGWVANRDVDALMEAVRQKGWLMRHAQEPEGDMLWVVDAKAREDVGEQVSALEGVRGTRALTLAVCRAVEAQHPDAGGSG